MFNYTIKQIQNYIIFYLYGRADILGAEKLEEEFKKLISEGKTNIILDFSEITYFSSTCMRVLIALRSKLEEINGNLKIVKMTRMVEKILVTLDLFDKYKIYDSLEQALKD